MRRRGFGEEEVVAILDEVGVRAAVPTEEFAGVAQRALYGLTSLQLHRFRLIPEFAVPVQG